MISLRGGRMGIGWEKTVIRRLSAIVELKCLLSAESRRHEQSSMSLK